jgi:hypothetical protein
MKRQGRAKKSNKPIRKKKGTYKVRNWHEYNNALINRYDVTLWIEQGIADVWREGNKIIIRRKRGAPKVYSDNALDCLTTLKELFHLTYRGIQGFGRAVFNNMLRLDITIPCYSTINRRRKGLTVNLPTKNHSTINITFDSSGLKVFGEGEWKVKKHGWSKHRTWRKIHLTINPDNSDIEAVELTENSIDDAAMVKPMLDTIHKKIRNYSGVNPNSLLTF